MEDKEAKVKANPTVAKAKETKAEAPKETSEEAPKKDEAEKKTTEGGNKTGLWIGLGISAVVIILGVIAAIFIPKMFKPDYKIMYDQSMEFYDELSDFMYNSSCYKASVNVTNVYSVSSETYKKYIDGCKEDVDEMYGMLQQFEMNSGVMKDSETKELYEKFLAVFNVNAPGSEKIETTLKAYEGMHEFKEGMDDLEYYNAEKLMSTDDFSKLVENLTDSGSEKLKVFGEGLKQRYDALVKAGKEYIAKQKAYNDTSFSSSNWESVYDAYSSAHDDFYDAEEDFYNYYYDEYPDDEDLDVHLVYTGDLGDGSIMDTFDDLQRAILKK